MTDFIDCYESIQTQIDRININSSSSYLMKKQTEGIKHQQFIKILSNIIDKITHLNHYETIEFDQDVYEFSFLDEQISQNYEVFVKITIKKSLCQIMCFLTILLNGLPIKFQQKSKRQLLNKLLLKVNTSFNNGNFSINPFSGQFMLCLSNLCTHQQFQSFFFEPSKLIHYLDGELKKGKEYLNYFINNILGYFDNKSYKIYNPVVQEKKKFLYKILPYTHLEFPFMYTQKTNYFRKVATVQKSKQLINEIQFVKSQRKKINDKLLSMMTNQNSILNPSENQRFFSKQDKEQCMKKLYPPILHHRSGEPTHVYSQIEILNQNIDWSVIDQGGFGVISKGFLQFFFPETDRDKNFARFVVKKDELDLDKKKLQHEKKIISKIKDDVNPFIVKFYYSKNPTFKNSLLMQYCPQRSILGYFYNRKQFMSLSTKLFLLRYVAQGIKFLKDHDICHLDLKPSNILVGSGQVRIIDFGEAYHPQVCNKYYRPGTSLPYAPPESYSPDTIRFSNKMDIFSFGILAFEFLFGTYPFLWSKSLYEDFIYAYKTKKYHEFMLFCPQKCERIGHPDVTELLVCLIFKCLSKDEDKRPCIQWLIIALQNCIELLNNL